MQRITMNVMSVATGCLALALVLSLGAGAQQPATQDSQKSQAAKVAVTEKGFEPSTITLKRNVPARVTFIRQTDKTCAKAIAIPEYKIERELPLNKPVLVEFTPNRTGEFIFACGMNMLKGKVVVEEN